MFFAVSLGSLLLGQAAPSGEALAAAQGAAFAVFHIIDRVSFSQTVIFSVFILKVIFSASISNLSWQFFSRLGRGRSVIGVEEGSY